MRERGWPFRGGSVAATDRNNDEGVKKREGGERTDQKGQGRGEEGQYGGFIGGDASRESEGPVGADEMQSVICSFAFRVSLRG